jgi:hypothetical protein
MDKIAAGPASDRRDLFRESASRLGMNPAIVEMDFWVCWILKLLFAEPALKNQTVFKGGTSLSKVFGLIDRFSETSSAAMYTRWKRPKAISGFWHSVSRRIPSSRSPGR